MCRLRGNQMTSGRYQAIDIGHKTDKEAADNNYGKLPDEFSSSTQSI